MSQRLRVWVSWFNTHVRITNSGKSPRRLPAAQYHGSKCYHANSSYRHLSVRMTECKINCCTCKYSLLFSGSTHDPYWEVDRQRGFSDEFKHIFQLSQLKWWSRLLQKLFTMQIQLPILSCTSLTQVFIKVITRYFINNNVMKCEVLNWASYRCNNIE